ncbi:C-type lectin domain family 4 member M-like [Hypomesus transpacificus]|uniref:C-type lectin domain family 4 member M-like n=1 Tax=Hypomesus transpacificus TaxID=137520 RepID=UPI001F08801D|nr:C-type lectin domain family 4 member M-like [Hypomesus transpacificus]
MFERLVKEHWNQRKYSKDIYAPPEMTQMVKSDRGEMEEMMVAIYASAGTLRGDQLSGAGGPERSFSRAAAVCLGLLCALLLAGVVALGVIYLMTVTVERHQLQTKYDILTRERDQLNTSNIILTRERDQLNTSYINLTIEIRQLNTNNTNNTNLTRERAQLQSSNTILTRERDDLKRRLCDVTSCPDGLQKFGCSCYYVSTEEKNWAGSRQDCRGRRADLVIINSPKEQEFLNNFTKRVWIGLSDTVTEGNFTWVHGTPLTTPMYWYSKQPDNHIYAGNVDEGCTEIYYPSPADTHVVLPKTWNDNRCDKNNYWVCERGI